MAPSTVSYLGGIHPLVGEEDRDVYQGYDGARQINLAVGEELEVSPEKAEQLAADFPGCFEIDGKVSGKRPKSSPAPAAAGGGGAGGDLHDELLKHTRADLNKAAAELGVDVPEALPNKAAVADAIVAAKAAAAGDE